MKINFTKNEYRLLLDMVEIAEWVLIALNADTVPPNTARSHIYVLYP